MGKIILRLDRVMADRKMSLKELSEKVGVSNVNLRKPVKNENRKNQSNSIFDVGSNL